MLAVSVNGETWDLTRPIEDNATVRLLKWEDDEGKHAYWHSSAHLMAEALQELYPGGIKFGIGPLLKTDSTMTWIRVRALPLRSQIFLLLKKKMMELITAKEDIERKVYPRVMP